MKFKKTLKLLISLAVVSPLSGSLLATAQIQNDETLNSEVVGDTNAADSRLIIPKPPVNLNPLKLMIQKYQLVEDWVLKSQAFQMDNGRPTYIKNQTQIMFHIQSTLPPTVINAFEYAINKFNEQFNSSQLVLKYTISANPLTSPFRVISYPGLVLGVEPWMETQNTSSPTDINNLVGSEIRVPTTSYVLPQISMRATAMHEILHSLGMDHAFPDARHSIDMRSWTLMNDGNISYFNTVASMTNPNVWQMTQYGDLDMELLKLVYINKITNFPMSLLPNIEAITGTTETNTLSKKNAQYGLLDVGNRNFLASSIDEFPKYSTDTYDRIGIWSTLIKNLMGITWSSGKWYNVSALKMTVGGVALTKGSQIKGNKTPIKVEYTLTPIGSTTKVTDSFTLNS